MKKIIVICALLANYAFAYCYYITCAPSVTAATAIAATNLEKSFLKINYQLNSTRDLYDEYATTLRLNSSAYKENLALKAEYLKTLKEISQIQEEIIEIKSKSGGQK
jgi:Skp family chaperone for outer membrane proteins